MPEYGTQTLLVVARVSPFEPHAPREPQLQDGVHFFLNPGWIKWFCVIAGVSVNFLLICCLIGGR
jgi:hypothetical protein